MAAAVTSRTRLVLVCNPNNPTGSALAAAELSAFVDALPSRVLIVLDEAYREFVTDPAVPDGIAAFGDRENVVVLRTLSKAWGLAGLRVGYLVGSPVVAGAVRTVATPFSVNVLAQAGALAALRAEVEMRRRVGLVTAERERLTAEVRRSVPATPASQANFVWLPVPDRTGDISRAAELGRACARAGIAVRAFADLGVRVTVGTPADNDAFLTVLAGWSAGQPEAEPNS